MPEQRPGGAVRELSRARVLVVGAIASVGVSLGIVAPPVVAIVLTAVAAVAGIATLRERERRLVAGLARDVNAWLTRPGHEPLEELATSPRWRELGNALNALGAAYQRRGEQLRRERPWRRQLVDALAGPAILIGRSDRVLAANVAARRLLRLPDAADLTATQAAGSVFGDLVPAARRTGQPVTTDANLDGRELRGTATPVGDEILVVLTDRTAERRLGEVRRDFVANASHELKSPVAAIASLGDALDVTLERDPDRARALVTSLNQETERLRILVRDLLDLNRVEDGTGLDPGPIDLAATVDREVRRVAEHHPDITVSCEVPDRLVIIGLDEDLRLVVRNLLENAVQYNVEGGEVRVTVTREADAAVLRVTDTGIGIPASDLDRVFERFYRVDVARSRETGGTGLGLAIVRHTVERLRGRISVDSLLGQGTTVTVRLPITP